MYNIILIWVVLGWGSQITFVFETVLEDMSETTKIK